MNSLLLQLVNEISSNEQTNLIIFSDIVFLNSFSQVDGYGVLKFLYEMSEDSVSTLQHLGNVQQLADLRLCFKQRPLSWSEC